MRLVFMALFLLTNESPPSEVKTSANQLDCLAPRFYISPPLETTGARPECFDTYVAASQAPARACHQAHAGSRNSHPLKL
jgi:hypothetical protein